MDFLAKSFAAIISWIETKPWLARQVFQPTPQNAPQAALPLSTTPEPLPTPKPATEPPSAPQIPSDPTPPQPVDIEHSDILYPKWDTPAHVRHNVRAICDQEDLTLKQKNDLTATVCCESKGFQTQVT